MNQETQKQGDIDTNLFSSYSTRHAATSAVFKTGGKTRTLNIFYNKHLTTPKDSFRKEMMIGSNIVWIC